MDLFDEAVNTAPLTRRTASEQEDLMAEWGLEATLNDEPEAALPSTDGADEDEAARVAARIAAALSGSPAAPPLAPAPPRTSAIDAGPRESEQQKAARLLAYADAIARGEEPTGPNPFSHVVGSQSDNEIAAAAKAHIAKAALKSYSPAERQSIIDEGVGVKASNLDRLDIKGTHYEALEATSAIKDDDFTFLDGDPNLPDI